MFHQKSLITLTLAALLLVGTVALAQTNSPPDIYGARDGSTLGGPSPAPLAPGDFILNEDFADITALAGWFMQNNSAPLGVTDWFQGNAAVFPAQAGAPDAYIGANFNNTAGIGIISNWLLTPEIDFSIVDTVHFWTRGPTGSIFPDRLEARLSEAGASTDVGTGAMDVGDFGEILVEINPTLVVGGYPEVWTEFVITNVGRPASGRIGFRYFVTDAGPAGNNSDYIGIDTVQVVEGEPIPTTTAVGLAMLVLMLAFVGVIATRQRIV